MATPLRSVLTTPTPPVFKRVLLGPARARFESHTRLRSLVAEEIVGIDEQAGRLLDELGEDQLNLSMGLVCLERAVDLVPYDPSSQAAARVLRTRIAELGELRDALQRVHFACAHPFMTPLLVKDAALGDYLRGVHAWTNGVARALEYLAVELRQLGVDWGSLRDRLDAAQTFHLEDLPGQIRGEVERLAGSHEKDEFHLFEDLATDLEALFTCAEWFSIAIQMPFG